MTGRGEALTLSRFHETLEIEQVAPSVDLIQLQRHLDRMIRDGVPPLNANVIRSAILPLVVQSLHCLGWDES